jgi:3-phenylpropionate/trans-cinnamate dioxygenase ferredoxin component
MSFVKVAKMGQITPGKAIRIEIDDEPIAIFNVDGELYAIGDTCSHEEASLSEGDVYGTCVECPLHGAEFDLKTGRPRTLPAVVPVPTYVVKVEGDDVLVDPEPQ